jgi:hypothetical protein
LQANKRIIDVIIVNEIKNGESIKVGRGVKIAINRGKKDIIFEGDIGGDTERIDESII